MRPSDRSTAMWQDRAIGPRSSAPCGGTKARSRPESPNTGSTCSRRRFTCHAVPGRTCWVWSRASCCLTSHRATPGRSRRTGPWAFARAAAPPAPGEEIVHHRFHMSRDVYQQMSPNINLLATRAISRRSSTAPRLELRDVCRSGTDAAVDALHQLRARRRGRLHRRRRTTPLSRTTGGSSVRDMVGRSLRALAVNRAGWRQTTPVPILIGRRVVGVGIRSDVKSGAARLHEAGGAGPNPLVRSRLVADAAGSPPVTPRGYRRCCAKRSRR